MASELQIPPFTSFRQAVFSQRALLWFLLLCNSRVWRRRGKETRHCGSMTHLHFTLKGVQECLHLFELVHVHRDSLLCFSVCVFTCVRTCYYVCVHVCLFTQWKRYICKYIEREDLLLPSLWHFFLCTGSRIRGASSLPWRLQRAVAPSWPWHHNSFQRDLYLTGSSSGTQVGQDEL